MAHYRNLSSERSPTFRKRPLIAEIVLVAVTDFQSQSARPKAARSVTFPSATA
jgi:hypothetical protein